MLFTLFTLFTQKVKIKLPYTGVYFDLLRKKQHFEFVFLFYSGFFALSLSIHTHFLLTLSLSLSIHTNFHLALSLLFCLYLSLSPFLSLFTKFQKIQFPTFSVTLFTFFTLFTQKGRPKYIRPSFKVSKPLYVYDSVLLLVYTYLARIGN